MSILWWLSFCFIGVIGNYQEEDVKKLQIRQVLQNTHNRLSRSVDHNDTANVNKSISDKEISNKYEVTIEVEKLKFEKDNATTSLSAEERKSSGNNTADDKKSSTKVTTKINSGSTKRKPKLIILTASKISPSVITATSKFRSSLSPLSDFAIEKEESNLKTTATISSLPVPSITPISSSTQSNLTSVTEGPETKAETKSSLPVSSPIPILRSSQPSVSTLFSPPVSTSTPILISTQSNLKSVTEGPETKAAETKSSSPALSPVPVLTSENDEPATNSTPSTSQPSVSRLLSPPVSSSTPKLLSIQSNLTSVTEEPETKAAKTKSSLPALSPIPVLISSQPSVIKLLSPPVSSSTPKLSSIHSNLTSVTEEPETKAAESKSSSPALSTIPVLTSENDEPATNSTPSTSSSKSNLRSAHPLKQIASIVDLTNLRNLPIISKLRDILPGSLRAVLPSFSKTDWSSVLTSLIRFYLEVLNHAVQLQSYQSVLVQNQPITNSYPDVSKSYRHDQNRYEYAPDYNQVSPQSYQSRSGSDALSQYEGITLNYAKELSQLVTKQIFQSALNNVGLQNEKSAKPSDWYALQRDAQNYNDLPEANQYAPESYRSALESYSSVPAIPKSYQFEPHSYKSAPQSYQSILQGYRYAPHSYIQVAQRYQTAPHSYRPTPDIDEYNSDYDY